MLIRQMDVVTAFLNGQLDDEIYIHQPDRYVVPGKEHLVCKFKKIVVLSETIPSMLVQCTSNMESTGFQQSAADPCVYVCLEDTMTIVAVYICR